MYNGCHPTSSPMDTPCSLITNGRPITLPSEYTQTSSQTDIFTSYLEIIDMRLKEIQSHAWNMEWNFQKFARLRIKWGSWDKNGSNVTVSVPSERLICYEKFHHFVSH
jgi:hypothetical protein